MQLFSRGIPQSSSSGSQICLNTSSLPYAFVLDKFIGWNLNLPIFDTNWDPQNSNAQWKKTLTWLIRQCAEFVCSRWFSGFCCPRPQTKQHHAMHNEGCYPPAVPSQIAWQMILSLSWQIKRPNQVDNEQALHKPTQRSCLLHWQRIGMIVKIAWVVQKSARP